MSMSYILRCVYQFLDMADISPGNLPSVLPGLCHITRFNLGANHGLSPTALLHVLRALPQLKEVFTFYYASPIDTLDTQMAPSASAIRDLTLDPPALLIEYAHTDYPPRWHFLIV